MFQIKTPLKHWHTALVDFGGDIMAKKKFSKFPRVRVHHLTIFQYDKNGDLCMTAEQIEKCLQARAGGFESYAFILHDKDTFNGEDCCIYAEKNHAVYLEHVRVLSNARKIPEDETTESGYAKNDAIEKEAHEFADSVFPPILPDTPKRPHWHIVLTFTQARALDEIARWFVLLNGEKLNANWNEAKSGHGAAESAWLYLIHQNAPKKYQYERKDVFASFDYESKLDETIKKHEDHEKYNIDRGDFNDVIAQVMHGMSKREAMSIVSEAEYIRNEAVFERARRWYILNEAPMPLLREVFYVDSAGIDEDHGKGGLGKSACSKAFAKQLAKRFGADISKNVNDLQDYIFIAGDAKVFLQDYDGQPIVLIDEINGTDFKRACKGVNGVKSLLAPYPERKSFDKKHGSVVCTAEYIIINGIQSFEAFKRALAKGDTIDGIAQESEDSVKEQFDRRFWGHIRIIDSSNIEFWANRGLFENTPEQQVLEMIQQTRASFQQIASRTSGKAQALLEGQVLRPMLEQVELSHETHGHASKIDDPDDLPEDLLSMGAVVDDDIQEPVIVLQNPRDVNDVFNVMVENDFIETESIEDVISFEKLIQRAINFHFYKIKYDDASREDKQFIRSAIMAIKLIEKGG